MSVSGICQFRRCIPQGICRPYCSGSQTLCRLLPEELGLLSLNVVLLPGQKNCQLRDLHNQLCEIWAPETETAAEAYSQLAWVSQRSHRFPAFPGWNSMAEKHYAQPEASVQGAQRWQVRRAIKSISTPLVGDIMSKQMNHALKCLSTAATQELPLGLLLVKFPHKREEEVAMTESETPSCSCSFHHHQDLPHRHIFMAA